MDLTPRLIMYFRDEGMDEPKCTTLALVLSEAITNALDHGVLGLNSSLKAEGFEAYEAARQARFERLESGEVGIQVQLNGQGPLMDLQVSSADIRVWDSGPGFDWEAVAGPSPEGVPSGRGLAIIRAVSSRVEFIPPGNQISFRIEFE